MLNYAWTCFWITTFVALMYRIQGNPTRAVLIERPVDTLIGAIVAALVVWFVLPVRERDKFRKALSGFLAVADGYAGAPVGHMMGAVEPAAVR